MKKRKLLVVLCAILVCVLAATAFTGAGRGSSVPGAVVSVDDEAVPMSDGKGVADGESEPEPAEEPEPEPEEEPEPEPEEEPADEPEAAPISAEEPAPVSTEPTESPEPELRYVGLHCPGGSFEGWSDFTVTLIDGKLPEGFDWYQPQRPGYMFKGWSAEEHGTEATYTEDGQEVPDDVTDLYAVWVRVVVLDAGPGNFKGDENQNYTRTVELDGDKLPTNLPDPPVYDIDVKDQTVEFKGWYTGKSVVTEAEEEDGWKWSIEPNGDEIKAGGNVPEGVTTLYAGYKSTAKVEEQKLVTYKLNWNGAQGSYGALECTRNYGSKFSAGNAFVTGLNVTGAWADFDKEINDSSSNEEVHAYWTKHPVNGYTFNGWFTEPVGGTEITIGTEIGTGIKNGQTLYAHWTYDNKGSDDLVDAGMHNDPAAGPVESARIDGQLSQSTHPGNSLKVVLSTVPSRADLSGATVTWQITTLNDEGKEETHTNGETESLKALGLTVTVSADKRTLTVTYDDNGDGKDRAVTVSVTVEQNGKIFQDPSAATLGFSHNWKESTKKEPTCEDKGEITYTCGHSGCEATKTESIAALEHRYNFSTTVTTGQQIKQPTCTEPGEKKFECLRCHKVDESRTITLPATGHNWKTTTVHTDCTTDTVTKTCANCGESHTSTVEADNYNLHRWSSKTTHTDCKTDTVTRTCLNCKKTEVNKVSAVNNTMHRWSTKTTHTDCKTDTVTKTCAICGTVEKTTKSANNASLHNWGAWVVTKEATATAAGVETRTCSVCNKSETRELPMKVSTVSTKSQLAAPKLTGVENTASGVKVTWGKVTGAAKYRVFYKTGSGSWTKITDTASTSYTWTGAKSGTAYQFHVQCVSSDGKTTTSAYSASKSITYLAAPGSVTVSNAANGVKISWGKVTGAAKYRIYYQIGSGDWTKIVDTTATSYTWTGAKSGTTYKFVVRCVNSAGTALTSSYTAIKSITYIAAPKNVTVSNAANGIKVTWTKSAGAVKYRVFYKPSGGSWAKAGDTTSNTFTWTGAKSGTTYQIRVWCVSSDGKTATSTYDGIKTITYKK